LILSLTSVSTRYLIFATVCLDYCLLPYSSATRLDLATEGETQEGENSSCTNLQDPYPRVFCFGVLEREPDEGWLVPPKPARPLVFQEDFVDVSYLQTINSLDLLFGKRRAEQRSLLLEHTERQRDDGVLSGSHVAVLAADRDLGLARRRDAPADAGHRLVVVNALWTDSPQEPSQATPEPERNRGCPGKLQRRTWTNYLISATRHAHTANLIG